MPGALLAPESPVLTGVAVDRRPDYHSNMKKHDNHPLSAHYSALFGLLKETEPIAETYDVVLIDLEPFLRGGRNRAPLEFLDGVGGASAVDIGATPIDATFEGRHRKSRCFQPKGAAPDPL